MASNAENQDGKDEEQEQSDVEKNEEEKNEEKKEDEASRGDDVESGSTPSDARTQTRFPFPKAFYDPKTKKLMMNPVVAPDGDSFEKDSEGLDPSVTYYPNRALQAAIEEQLDEFADAGSMRGTLMKWQKSMRSGWQQLLEKSTFPAGQYRPLPDAFYCPISFDLIHEPAIDPDGHSYEKAAIVHWLQNNDDSPVTRNPLTADQLRNNNALLSVLEFLTQEEDQEAVHPSIRRWKTEHSTRINTSTHEIVPTQTASATNASSPAATNTRPTTTVRVYATNRAELEAEQRRRQNQAKRVEYAWCIALMIVFIFFPSYLFSFFVVTFALFLLAVLCCQNQANHDARREQVVQNARAPDPPGAHVRPGL